MGGRAVAEPLDMRALVSTGLAYAKTLLSGTGDIVTFGVRVAADGGLGLGVVGAEEAEGREGKRATILCVGYHAAALRGEIRAACLLVPSIVTPRGGKRSKGLMALYEDKDGNSLMTVYACRKRFLLGWAFDLVEPVKERGNSFGIFDPGSDLPAVGVVSE